MQQRVGGDGGAQRRGVVAQLADLGRRLVDEAEQSSPADRTAPDENSGSSPRSPASVGDRRVGEVEAVVADEQVSPAESRPRTSRRSSADERLLDGHERLDRRTAGAAARPGRATARACASRSRSTAQSASFRRTSAALTASSRPGAARAVAWSSRASISSIRRSIDGAVAVERGGEGRGRRAAPRTPGCPAASRSTCSSASAATPRARAVGAAVSAQGRTVERLDRRLEQRRAARTVGALRCERRRTTAMMPHMGGPSVVVELGKATGTSETRHHDVLGAVRYRSAPLDCGHQIAGDRRRRLRLSVASTMTRTSGSVPLGRTSTRPSARPAAPRRAAISAASALDQIVLARRRRRRCAAPGAAASSTAARSASARPERATTSSS